MNRTTDRQADSRETLAKEDDVVRKIPPRNGSGERGVFYIYRGGTGEMLVTAIHYQTHSLTKPHGPQEQQTRAAHCRSVRDDHNFNKS